MPSAASGTCNMRKSKVDTKVQHFTVTSIEKLAASELPGGLFEVPKCESVDKDRMNNNAIELFKGIGFAH